MCGPIDKKLYLAIWPGDHRLLLEGANPNLTWPEETIETAPFILSANMAVRLLIEYKRSQIRSANEETCMVNDGLHLFYNHYSASR